MKRIIELEQLPDLVGQELALSEWFQIDQGMITRFADIVDDHQWIHVDVERANRENGGTIAHGFLTLALLTTLSDRQLEWRGAHRRLNYGFNRVRFVSVVHAGSQVRLREKLLAVENKGTRQLITRECTIEIFERDDPAVVAEWLILAVP